jgi:hypothetical protein
VTRRFEKTVGGILATLVCATAYAAPKDKEVLALVDKAIYTDYLGAKFPESKAKLEKAEATCAKPNACSDNVKARIHVGSGVLYAVALKEPDKAKQHFVKAFKLDPTARVESDLMAPEVQSAIDAAKKEIGGAPEEPTETPEAPEAPPPVKGDGEHTAPTEQAVLTPVPIYYVPPGEAARVEVRYRAFGTAKWKAVDLTRHKDGYAGEIPCLDVGTTTGDLLYFIQAFGADGAVLAAHGTTVSPHRVAIKNELSGEPPHVPGKPPPAQCRDHADCPPGLPGCAAASSDGDGDGEASDGAKPTRAKKNWIGLGIQQDFMLFQAEDHVCSGGNDYTCFYEPDIYYDGIPVDVEGANGVAAGVGRATTRFLLGYDRLFGENLTLGARLGYAIGGGPKAPGGAAFLPIHAEARVGYWFGDDPFGNTGPRPFVLLAGGLAQVDSKVVVTVYRNQTEAANDQRTDLNAWKKSGNAFVGGGFGLAIPLGDSLQASLELKVVRMIGRGAWVIAPRLGAELGF